MNEKESEIENVRERFTINKEFYNLLKKEAHLQGKNESQMLNHILYESLVKRDNRLSNHIARDNENLLLMLLTEPEKKYGSLQEIFKERDTVSRNKSSLIKEIRNKKKTQENNFWKEILKVISIEEFKKLNGLDSEKKKEKSFEKIIEIFKIVSKYKGFLNV